MREPLHLALVAVFFMTASGGVISRYEADAAPASSTGVHSLQSALLRYAELPPRESSGAGYPINTHHSFEHFNASMCTTNSEYWHYSPFCCDPPKALMHLHLKQSVVQQIDNLGDFEYDLCGFRFDTLAHAHQAFTDLTRPLKAALRSIPTTARLALPAIGQERFGVTGRDIGKDEVVYRSRNVVISVRALTGDAQHANQLVSVVVKESRHLH